MMHPHLRTLLYDSEISYLQTPQLKELRTQVVSLQERLGVYEHLRDREIAIFQPIADRLEQDFASENPKTLESALRHWLSVMRYCSMAMLLDNPEFLQHRLLEWLTDVVKAHQMEAIETHLYGLLQEQLSLVLSQPELAAIQPFLEQARATLLGSEEDTQVSLEFDDSDALSQLLG